MRPGRRSPGGQGWSPGLLQFRACCFTGEPTGDLSRPHTGHGLQRPLQEPPIFRRLIALPWQR